MTKAILLLTHIDTYRDGGTKRCKDHEGNIWYVDDRMWSNPKGLLYSVYPGDEGAEPINREYKIIATDERRR